MPCTSSRFLEGHRPASDREAASAGGFCAYGIILSCQIEEVDRALRRGSGASAEQPEQGWTRAELETHLRQEYSTFTWLFEAMLRQAGFEIQDATYSESLIYAGYTCIRTQ